MTPPQIEALVREKFPQLSSLENLEEHLSSLETMELLLHLEKALGVQLQAIELEPLLQGNLRLFTEIVNGKS